MKRLVILPLSLVLALLLTPYLLAEETIVIKKSWIREAPPPVEVLAAYMVIKNLTDKDIILTDAESSRFKHVMFHQSVLENGIVKMRHVENIVIPAHSSFEFKPGGFHLMLMGKEKILQAGDKVQLRLFFENNDPVEVLAVVKKIEDEE